MNIELLETGIRLKRDMDHLRANIAKVKTALVGAPPILSTAMRGDSSPEWFVLIAAPQDKTAGGLILSEMEKLLKEYEKVFEQL